MKQAHHKVFISLLVFVILGLAVAVTFVWPSSIAEPSASTTLNAASFDPLNVSYSIDGQAVRLMNGVNETPTAPGSATTVETKIFGQPAYGDLNGDGASDAAVFIVENPGGSGTFYYVAASLATATGTQGTNAILLGDRIAPQTLQIKNGQIVANYADRAPGDPMSSQPSIGVSKYFAVNDATLSEVSPVAGPGEHCGGNMLNAPTCGAGYYCAPEPGSHLPFGDVGGVCVLD